MTPCQHIKLRLQLTVELKSALPEGRDCACRHGRIGERGDRGQVSYMPPAVTPAWQRRIPQSLPMSGLIGPIGTRLLKVECLLTSAIWSYEHEAEVYIFLNLPFPSNPKENSSIRCILSTPEQNLL